MGVRDVVVPETSMLRAHPVPMPRRRRASGFSLIEVMFGTVVLTIALLGHMASTFSEYRLARTDETRSEVLHLARQFVERARSDEDWSHLYARLRALQVLAEKPGIGGERLEDGRRVWPANHYYAEFVTPEWLESFSVLVEVPAADDGGLREDLVQPHFGLPADLNRDGTVDAEPRDDDYQALPVVFHLRWHPTGESPQELRIHTWLRRSL